MYVWTRRHSNVSWKSDIIMLVCTYQKQTRGLLFSNDLSCHLWSDGTASVLGGIPIPRTLRNVALAMLWLAYRCPANGCALECTPRFYSVQLSTFWSMLIFTTEKQISLAFPIRKSISRQHIISNLCFWLTIPARKFVFAVWKSTVDRMLQICWSVPCV